MTRRAPLLVRALALALVLSVLGMHVPLDAFATEATETTAATAAAPTACCAATCAGPAGSPQEAAAPVAGAPAAEGARAPGSTDGCDEGCHCGCCGGLPIAGEGSGGAPLAQASRRARAAALVGARPLQPHDVFHPPRA